MPHSEAEQGSWDVRRQAWQRAQTLWPALRLGFADFCAYLEERGATDALPEHADALFLCCACARGDPGALQSFEREYLQRCRAAIGMLDEREDFVADVLQLTRERLFCGNGARIRTYTGKGPLLGWVRSVARRVALNHIKQERRAAARGRGSAERGWLPPGQGTEALALKGLYAPLFERAFSQVLAALPERESAMLRLQLDEGLNAEAIARLYAVDRTTVQRRLARCHEEIRKGVRARLMRQLGALTRSEFDSLFRLIESRLSLGIEAALPAQE